MRATALLFLLLPALALCRMELTDDEYLKAIQSSTQWDDWEGVQQPNKPIRRRHSRYSIRFFNWTTNATKLRKWNDANITIEMHTFDLGIVCKFDKTQVVLRLISAENADLCEDEGVVVAHCPDLNRIPLIYADVRGPGDYVLTTYSDGTREGKHATSGGFCSQGVKFPIKIVDLPRDDSRFPEPALHKPPRPPPPATDKLVAQSATSVPVSITILLALILI